LIIRLVTAPSGWAHAWSRKKQTRRESGGGFGHATRDGRGSSLLPRALLVAVRLQALAALVLVHLQASFLL